MLALGGTISGLDAHQSRICNLKDSPHRIDVREWLTEDLEDKQPIAAPYHLWRTECNTPLGFKVQRGEHMILNGWSAMSWI
jgi:hypothetical protein